jgi:hypothetical protein
MCKIGRARQLLTESTQDRIDLHLGDHAHDAYSSEDLTKVGPLLEYGNACFTAISAHVDREN